MKLRILLVDDDQSILDVTRTFFEARGHEVITAANPTLLPVCYGRECNQAHPCADMVLIDFSMPRMTGLEFLELQESRGCKLTAANKFIMTGEPGKVDPERAKKVSCRVLAKPVVFAQLDELLKQVKSQLSPDRKLADLSYKL